MTVSWSLKFRYESEQHSTRLRRNLKSRHDPRVQAHGVIADAFFCSSLECMQRPNAAALGLAL